MRKKGGRSNDDDDELGRSDMKAKLETSCCVFSSSEGTNGPSAPTTEPLPLCWDCTGSGPKLLSS